MRLSRRRLSRSKWILTISVLLGVLGVWMAGDVSLETWSVALLKPKLVIGAAVVALSKALDWLTDDSATPPKR